MFPLFDRYPELKERLPHVSLGLWPTPVERAPGLEAELGLAYLHVKRDDLSGQLYGGNKVRKLEFLLARAKAEGRSEVMTYGFAGSNHALCTAMYAHQLGMRSISMLLPQPKAKSVRQSLLVSASLGAEVHHYRNYPLIVCGTLWQMLRHGVLKGRFPLRIPAGGTNPLGIVGFVNAMFELHAQAESGSLPMPEVIYLPVGSMGTAVGLQVGIRLLGLETQLMPVRVIPLSHANRRKLVSLFDATVAFLRAHCRDIPELTCRDEDFPLRHEFIGPGYGVYTEAGNEAAECFARHLGVELDGTYSAKAFAALMCDAREGRLEGRSVVFWNTYNSREWVRTAERVQRGMLPRSTRQYFEPGPGILGS